MVTNGDIELALRFRDEYSSEFASFIRSTQGGTEEAKRGFDSLGKSEERAVQHTYDLRDAMKENRFENRRNKFILGEMNDGMEAITGTMRSVGLNSQGMTESFAILNKTTASGMNTFMGFNAIMEPLGLAGGPLVIGAMAAVGLGVAIGEMSSEAEKSAEKILTTAEAVNALDAAYTEYSSHFRSGARDANLRKAQMEVAKKDAESLQQLANDMLTFTKVFTGEKVKVGNIMVLGMRADEELAGEGLLKRLEKTMPRVYQIYDELLRASEGEKKKAQGRFFDELHDVQARLKAAQAAALNGILKDDEEKEKQAKIHFEKMSAMELAYINDAQKKRIDDMIHTAEAIRTFMRQAESDRHDLVVENNDAFVRQTLASVRTISATTTMGIDKSMTEIDDGWKLFLSSVDAGVESLSQSITDGFARGWEEAFGEANSVLEKFLEAMYMQTMQVLAKIAAQKFVSSIFSLIPGAGSVVAAAYGSAGGGLDSNSKSMVNIGDLAGGSQRRPATPFVVQVNLRGTLSGQRFLQDEMPSYGKYQAAKAI